MRTTPASAAGAARCCRAASRKWRDFLSSADGIRVERDPERAILRVTLDNPPGNRLGLAQLEALHALAGSLATLDAESADIRVVVLDATGPDFSHGANLSDGDLAARLVAGRESRIAFARLGQELVSRWGAIAVPTVAVATGHVVGAGACIYFASDFRVAAPDVHIRFPEVDRGMHLGWGIVPRLVALLGTQRAARLALLAEAIAAQEFGDVLTVATAPGDTGLALAQQLAAKPPLAVRAILATLRDSLFEGARAATLDAEKWADTLASEDFAEAMAAWFERRPALWKGR